MLQAVWNPKNRIKSTTTWLKNQQRKPRTLRDSGAIQSLFKQTAAGMKQHRVRWVKCSKRCQQRLRHCDAMAQPRQPFRDLAGADASSLTTIQLAHRHLDTSHNRLTTPNHHEHDLFQSQSFSLKFFRQDFPTKCDHFPVMF